MVSFPPVSPPRPYTPPSPHPYEGTWYGMGVCLGIVYGTDWLLKLWNTTKCLYYCQTHYLPLAFAASHRHFFCTITSHLFSKASLNNPPTNLHLLQAHLKLSGSRSAVPLRRLTPVNASARSYCCRTEHYPRQDILPLPVPGQVKKCHWRLS